MKKWFRDYVNEMGGKNIADALNEIEKSGGSIFQVQFLGVGVPHDYVIIYHRDEPEWTLREVVEEIKRLEAIGDDEMQPGIDALKRLAATLNEEDHFEWSDLPRGELPKLSAMDKDAPDKNIYELSVEEIDKELARMDTEEYRETKRTVWTMPLMETLKARREELIEANTKENGKEGN